MTRTRLTDYAVAFVIGLPIMLVTTFVIRGFIGSGFVSNIGIPCLMGFLFAFKSKEICDFIYGLFP